MTSTGDVTTLSADGNSPFRTFKGPVRLSLTGDFGTGTAKLQANDPGGNVVDIAGGSFTAATDTLYDFPEGAKTELRVNLASSSAPDLLVWLQGTKV